MKKFCESLREHAIKIGLESSISQNIRHFFRVGFFNLRAWKIHS